MRRFDYVIVLVDGEPALKGGKITSQTVAQGKLINQLTDFPNFKYPFISSLLMGRSIIR